MKPQLSSILMGIVFFIATLPLDGVRATEAAPDALVKSTTEEVLAVIKQTAEREKLMQLAENKVLPYFDFKRMTRLALGKSWAQATLEQQQELEKEFRDLLVRTYTNALAAGGERNASVSIKPMHAASDASEVTVRTAVTTAGSPSVPIDYEMEKTEEGWKVYDVVVANVSLVTSYRDSFAAEVKKGGVDGLLRALADKNKQLAAGKVEPTKPRLQ